MAVTEVAADMVTAQVPVPVHPPPDQPVKVEPGLAAAVSVTTVPLGKFAVQVAPHVIPAGTLLTDPAPVPAGTTVSA